MISIQNFLNLTNLSISEDIILEEFNTTDLQDFSQVLLSDISFTENEAIEGLLQSSKTSDKTDNPSTPSYQPLNEAGVLTSGESLNKSTIGSITNNSISIQNDAQLSIENTAKFSPDTNFNLTEETLRKMKEAQQTLNTGVKSLANGAELANSGIKFAGGNLQFASNSVQIGTDGVVHITSPIINTVAEVENKQANTIQSTSNHITTVTKSSFKQVEELDSTVSQNKMSTVTQSDINISNFKSTTALEKLVNNSQSIENTAGSLIKNRSQEGIINEAEGIITTTSPSIIITAAEGAKSQNGSKEVIGSNSQTGLLNNEDGSFDVTAVSSTGETIRFSGLTNNRDPEKWKSIGGLEGRNASEIEPSTKRRGKGDLNILADGSSGTVSIINKNTIVSSTQNYNTSVGGNLSHVAQGNLTNSARFINTEADAGLTLNASGYIRQQSGRTGTFISNGFTFAGFRFPTLSRFIDKAKNIPLEIREIPSLSKLPLPINIDDLNNCLPEKYTQSDLPEDEIDSVDLPDEIAAPTEAEARQREKPSAIPVGKEEGSINQGGLIEAVQNKGSTKINGTTMLSTNKGPTDQTAIPQNKLTSAAVIFKGGSDVYAPESQEAFDLFKRQGSLIIDPDASEEVGGVQLTKDLIAAISNLSITNISIKLNQIPEFSQVLIQDIPALQNYLFNKFGVPEDLLTNNQLLTQEQTSFINNAFIIPEVKLIIDELELAIQSRIAVGGVLSFLSEAHERISSSISIASDLIEDNSNANVFQVLKGASNIAETVSDNNIFTDISKIIESSDTLSNIYGQVNSIIKDGQITTSQVIDNLNFKDIEAVISSGLNSIGKDNLETASSIARILRQIKNSPDYKQNGLTLTIRERIISDIITETGLDNNEARNLYEQAQDVIADVLTGNIENVVPGSELQNILGFFIGNSNAALLSDLRRVYLRGQTVLQQGQELFQNGRDFYSTIQSIPALISLMNNYEIPLLNQVKVVLQCFELLAQVRRILENIKSASRSFDQFGNTIQDTFDSFEDLTTDARSIPTNDILQSVTEGFASGVIASTLEPNIEVAQQNIVPTLINNPLLDINNITNETFIDGQLLTPENCSTVILSYDADTRDSSNISDWEEVITEEDVIDIIEKLPRLTQIYNSIKEVPPEVAINTNKTIFNDITPNQLEALQNTEPVVPLNPCYIAPKLNLIESTVEVIEIQDNIMLYKMKFPESLKFNNKNIFPSNTTIVQIYVEKFFNNKTNQEMEVYRSEQFFSPHIYSFKTSIYDRDKNLGVAYLMNSQTRIHLKSTSDIPYNYSITDIGRKLNPIIIDAYIVA